MKTALLTIIALGLLATAPSVSARGADPVNKGPLNVFRRDTLHCSGGWRFTGLIWGDRPVSACMIKTKRKNVFGGQF